MEVHQLSHGSKSSRLPAEPAVVGENRTYFCKPEVQYLPLTEDGDIEMTGFLRACRGIVVFVSFLGKAFSLVKEDINGNITKVDRVYQTNAERYASVKKLMDAEIADWPNRMGPATEALLWLKRALEFISVFLDLFVTDHKSGKKSHTLVAVGSEAYGRTLKKHHGTVESGLFKVVIRATPYRKDFLKRISCGRTGIDDECVSDIERYLAVMKANVEKLVAFYKEYGFEK